MGSDAPRRTGASTTTSERHGARGLPARPARSRRDTIALAFATAGTLLLLVATFLPWYRDTGADGGTVSAWGGYWFVIAELLVLFLVGARLVLGAATGRPLRGPALTAAIVFSFCVTITVVISLFIARPGGNAARAVDFGGYVSLAALGTIKGGAVMMAAGARKRSRS